MSYFEKYNYEIISIDHDDDKNEENEYYINFMNNIKYDFKKIQINFGISFYNYNGNENLYKIFQKYLTNLPTTLEKIIINLHVNPYDNRIYPQQINKDKLLKYIKIPFNCSIDIAQITVDYPY